MRAFPLRVYDLYGLYKIIYINLGEKDAMSLA